MIFKRTMTHWMTTALLAGTAFPVLGQDAGDNRPPPPRPEDRREEPRGDDNGPPPRDQNRSPRDNDGRPRRGQAARPISPFEDGAPPQVRTMAAYLQLVDQYKHLTEDPTAAGVAAVITSADVLRVRGPQAGIDYFEKLLTQIHPVNSPAVANAIHLQLADLYRANHNPDKALEHLTAMMTDTGEPLKIPATQPAK